MAVTRSVAALEESLEVQLFERKGRGILLTAAGEVVRLRADCIASELRRRSLSESPICWRAAPAPRAVGARPPPTAAVTNYRGVYQS
jgi:DNA-binding transcriptional LysR family regulator